MLPEGMVQPLFKSKVLFRDIPTFKRFYISWDPSHLIQQKKKIIIKICTSNAQT